VTADCSRDPEFSYFDTILAYDRQTHTHTHTCGLVDGTSMNEECAAVDAVGSMPPL